MYGIKTAKDAEAMLADAQLALVKAATEGSNRIADRANEVEEWRGVVMVMAEWERSVERIEKLQASPERTLIEKYATLARLAVRSADDTWSGRGNDAKRAFQDGRLKALSRIETKLDYEDKDGLS